MPQATFEEAQNIVLANIDAWISDIGPKAQLPSVMIRDLPYSPLAIRGEVAAGTEIGIEYIAMKARELGYVIV